MENLPEKYIERLNELLLKKKARLIDILSLTQEQTDAIDREDLDSLNKLIQSKQLKIDEINKLDEEFNACYSRLKSVSGSGGPGSGRMDAAMTVSGAPESAKQLKEVTAEILGIISDISEIEKKNSLKSKKLLEQYGNEIKKINQGKKASNAYKSGSLNAPSYFLDKKN